MISYDNITHKLFKEWLEDEMGLELCEFELLNRVAFLDPDSDPAKFFYHTLTYLCAKSAQIRGLLYGLRSNSRIVLSEYRN